MRQSIEIAIRELKAMPEDRLRMDSFFYSRDLFLGFGSLMDISLLTDHKLNQIIGSFNADEECGTNCCIYGSCLLTPELRPLPEHYDDRGALDQDAYEAHFWPEAADSGGRLWEMLFGSTWSDNPLDAIARLEWVLSEDFHLPEYNTIQDWQMYPEFAPF